MENRRWRPAAPASASKDMRTSSRRTPQSIPNSGGALVSLNGEVVGINTAIVGPSSGNVGIGFAILINIARDIMRQLIAHGEIKRVQFGVTIQDLTPDLAKTSRLDVEMGAVVNEVIAGSSAEKTGIQAGDVVTEVNGQPISGASNLRNKRGPIPIGSELHITLIRNGASKSFAPSSQSCHDATVCSQRPCGVRPRLRPL